MLSVMCTLHVTRLGAGGDVLTSDYAIGQWYVVPSCDRVTTSYTCTATKSASSNHKVRDVTLGRAKGQRGWMRRVEFESPRRPSCRHRTSAAHYKYLTIHGHNRQLILLVLVLVPRPSHTTNHVLQPSHTNATTSNADQNRIRLTKTYYR
jgi:hypothetical protein